MEANVGCCCSTLDETCSRRQQRLSRPFSAQPSFNPFLVSWCPRIIEDPNAHCRFLL
ncbi:hypothetical protein BDY19DRAFT_946182 [Irpex rosettiformis]|uniref:Uncharacterized protein n=1 Tax=Irpex rosettiformis TaxID=378272 RepID=A0ACB8U376_9APHY|nr:hypothetical protein BDY19DRAFT_946182 [Irpex rosettiformis]